MRGMFYSGILQSMYPCILASCSLSCLLYPVSCIQYPVSSILYLVSCMQQSGCRCVPRGSARYPPLGVLPQTLGSLWPASQSVDHPRVAKFTSSAPKPSSNVSNSSSSSCLACLQPSKPFKNIRFSYEFTMSAIQQSWCILDDFEHPRNPQIEPIEIGRASCRERV